MNPDRLEGLVSDLAGTGLMAPGRDDPLPVPAHFDDESALLGWIGPGRDLPDLPDAAVLPPSTVPGSRNSPGYLGSVMGLVTGHRGEANRADIPLPAAPFVWLGTLFAIPLIGRTLAVLFALSFAAAIVAVAEHRHAWVLSGIGLVSGYRWILPLIVGLALVNLVSAATRAAAVARFTPGTVRLGLLFSGPLRIPKVFVDTAGAAESADRHHRMRIVAAGLVGPAALVVLAVLAWFFFHATAPAIAQYTVSTTCVAIVALVLRLNPLALYEGYYLLAHGLGHPDLRTQAWSSVFGVARPWPVATGAIPRSKLLLYAALSVVFLIGSLVLMFLFMGNWLSHRFGGIGFLILVGALALTISDRYVRSDAIRSGMGRPKSSFKPGLRTWIAAAVVLVVCVLPYHYEPSGTFTILPGDQADIVALVPGDVEEIKAVEGQWVQAGQEIVRLDDAAQRAALAAAEAAVAAQQSEVALVKSGSKREKVELAQQKEAVARTVADFRKGEAQRMATAFRGKAVTAADRDRAAGAADVAQGDWLEAQRELHVVAAHARTESVDRVEADLHRLMSDRDRQKELLDDAHVRSPIAGRLIAPDLRYARGRYLAKGSQVAQVETPSPRIAEIEFAEADARYLEEGGDGAIRPLMLNGSTIAGHIVSIAPNAEDGEDGPFVRVRLAVDDPDDRLRSGLTGMAKADGGWHPAILVFTRALARYLLVRVWSWMP